MPKIANKHLQKERDQIKRNVPRSELKEKPRSGVTIMAPDGEVVKIGQTVLKETSMADRMKTKKKSEIKYIIPDKSTFYDTSGKFFFIFVFNFIVHTFYIKIKPLNSESSFVQ